MHGGPDQEARRADGSERPHGQRGARSLHAVRAHRERHVRPVVHEEPRPVTAGGLTEPAGQGEEIADLEVLLSELHGLEPGLEACLDGSLEGSRDLRAIRDEAE